MIRRLKASILHGILLLVLTTLALSPAPVSAQITPTTALESRAEELVEVLQGSRPAGEFFDPIFLAAIPATQFEALVQSLIATQGAPQSVQSIQLNDSWTATVKIRFEHGVGSFPMVLSPKSPHRVTGLRFTGFTVVDDSYHRIAKDFDALPGKTGFLVAKLDGTGMQPIVQGRATQSFAIGSTFKLYILDELTAQIAAGRRHWADVVPLSQFSFSSSATQNWPVNAPVTLQTLASWMISVSDNGAADTLIHILGPEVIEARIMASGHSHPCDLSPLLTTVEAFALKAPEQADIRMKFLAMDDIGQRQLLKEHRDRLTLAHVDMNHSGIIPHFIDQIEWFATPHDVAKLLRDIKTRNDPVALSILSINPGVSSEQAAAWSYLGYKGGSETGVIAMSYLGQRKDGDWIVVSTSWNNTEAAVKNDLLARLSSRLLAMAAQ